MSAVPIAQPLTSLSHLGNTPETFLTQDGWSTKTFLVSVNEKCRDTQLTTWFRVTAWQGNTPKGQGSPRGEKTTIYICNYCGNGFDDHTTVLDHIATTHGIAMPTEITTDMRIIETSLCDRGGMEITT